MKLEVFFDYTCPFCLVGHAYLVNLRDRYPGLEVEWRPCEAHPRPEPRSTVPQRPQPWYAQLQRLAQGEGCRLEQPHNPVPHSDLAIQGMLAVRDLGGDLWEYQRLLYQAVFEQAQDIEDLRVIARCVALMGIAEKDVTDAVESGRYRQEQQELNHYAYERQEVWAVPAYRAAGAKLDSAAGIGISKRQLADFLDSLEAGR